MPEGHNTTIEVSNIMSFVLYTQILKQSVLKPASPGITLSRKSKMSFVFFIKHCVSYTKLILFYILYRLNASTVVSILRLSFYVTI